MFMTFIGEGRGVWLKWNIARVFRRGTMMLRSSTSRASMIDRNLISPFSREKFVHAAARQLKYGS